MAPRLRNERSYLIRGIVLFCGSGSILIGLENLFLPRKVTDQLALTYLHQTSQLTWGCVWLTLGLLVILVALTAWKWVIAPLGAQVCFLCFWAAELLHAAYTYHGFGLTTATFVLLVAGLNWAAALRAAAVPDLKRRPIHHGH